ncbi:MAG TPA: SDR family NAD(P)-dependent oxidoreductase [Candidatus Acidoferrales bacterium]|nr:SDR family NAD(P)-dependent oxidoreductase [Candidatus Acidoferrales bacterium]
MRLAGRVALITGAGSGLGREIALTFAREGAKIAVNDIHRDAAERVAKEVEAAGSAAVTLIADVSDIIEVLAIFEQLVATFGTLDILVNNAGIAVMSDAVKTRFVEMINETLSAGRSTQSVGATRTMSDSQWRRTLSIHLDGTFYCTREALQIMEPKGAGKIINMASIAGTTGLLGSPDYSAAKAGIIGLTKSVAREVIGRGIYVNAIAPGYIDTPLLDVMDEPMKQMIALQTPIGRLGTPQEVAAVALYLASDDSSYTVGQVISPNGGYHI